MGSSPRVGCLIGVLVVRVPDYFGGPKRGTELRELAV